MYTLPGSGNPNFHLANSKDFLSGDKGIWTKITDTLDWIADNTPLQRMRMINSDRDMTITMGYKDPYGVRKGLGSSVFAISLKDNPEKARGIRGPLIHYEEDGLFDNLEKAWNVNLKAVEDGDSSFGYMLAGGCLTSRNKVWTKDGRLVYIDKLVKNDGIIGYNGLGSSREDINWFKEPTKKECLRLTTSGGDYIECSIDHPLMNTLPHWRKQKGKDYVGKFIKFNRADELKVGDQLLTIDKLDIFGNKTICDFKLINSLPENIHEYNKESLSNIIGELFNNNGSFHFNEKRNRVRITLSNNNHDFLSAVKYQLVRFGIHSKILVDKKAFRLYITTKTDLERFRSGINITSVDKLSILKMISVMTDTDRTRLSEVQTGYFKFNEEYPKGEYFKDEEGLCNFRQEVITSIENIGEQYVYNLNTSITNTYLGNNFITGNTGGTQGASFEGSEKLFYSPAAYNVMGVPNVYDRNADGSTECGFFWGAYMSRNKCYDLEVGEPDVIKALIEILEARYIVKYSSTDMMAITQKKAEDPITPQEAVMRTTGTVFPVSDLKEHLENISIYKEKFLSEHYIGDLVRTADGEVRFVPDDTKIPLRSYDKIPNDRTGGIEIFEMPRKNNEGRIQSGRYIAGIDPIDADNGTSLFSIIVMDLFTDRIVAEYSGRPRFAEDAYDIALRLLDFYNAIGNYEQNLKGLFSYFDKHSKLYRLCDTPQILKDMDLAKGGGYGNNAHPYSQKVITPLGKREWGSIKVGDWLYDDVGGTVKVKSIPFDDLAPVYEITLKDGRKVKASSDHIWKVIDWNNLTKLKTTEEMFKCYYRNKGKYKESKYYIPKNEGVHYDFIEVPLDSYTLGLLLGDGSFSGVSDKTVMFSSGLEDVETYKKHSPYIFGKPYDNRHMRIQIPLIRTIVKDLNLYYTRSRTKFIPDLYKYNSRHVRLEILKGLFDTDGTLESGCPSFTSTSKTLAEDVLEVSRSLGINGNIRINSNNFGFIYTVTIHTDVPMFKLKRKLDKQRLTKTRSYKTGIVNIELIGNERSKCVEVDSEDGLYLIGDYIVTHNSKGTRANKETNKWGRMLQAEWQKRFDDGIESKSLYDEEGNSRKLKLHSLRGIAYIEECIKWTEDGNFDRVSAGGMLMILREDKYKITESSKSNESVGSTLAQDNFFKKNYKK